MADIESRLGGLGLLQNHRSQPFLPESNKDPSGFNGMWGIEDDHIPFMRRGVDVLHIIPTPFPIVWHTANDDGAHLDIPTVEDWASIVTAFVGEWMDLEGFFPPKAKAEAKFKDKRTISRKTEL